jgi:serine/threonine protein kinase
MNNVKREISILKRVEHSNIIKLCWAIEDKKSVLIHFMRLI